MTPAQRLRSLLEDPGLLVAPGCFDGLSARIVRDSGARAAYMTGYGTAATHGHPDTGRIAFEEMSARAALLASTLDVPLMADADTGYDDVGRTARTYARAGVAGIQIEDQVWPKRCGHTGGRRVVPVDEAVERIRAAAAVRDAGDDILVIARTDARDVEGLDAALDRLRAYDEAGADILFCEALASREEMEAATKVSGKPSLVNLIEDGSTPLLPHDELADLGFKLAIYPLTLLYAAADGMRRCLGEDGAMVPWRGGLSFRGLCDTVGFPGEDG